MKNLINDLVISNEEIYAYLDELVDKGHEIVANWDGGNDSGMVYFTIDGNIVNPESPFDYAIFDRLEEMINDKLGYGSWAGDFHAYGEAQYDHKTHSFIGDNTEEIIDYNSEDFEFSLEDSHNKDLHSTMRRLFYQIDFKLALVDEHRNFIWQYMRDKSAEELAEVLSSFVNNYIYDEDPKAKRVANWSVKTAIKFVEFIKYKY